MNRVAKVLLTLGATGAVGVSLGACGEQWISVPKSAGPLYHGAVLFNERCGGCHTLSYAGTHGSAQFVRTKEFNNGPNFNVRCERPVARVLYAIENGGFSGQIMPQNIVVGQDAIDVAKFVATYAGRQAPPVPGIVPCSKLQVGTIPSFVSNGTSGAGTGASGGSGGTSTSTTATTGTKKSPGHSGSPTAGTPPAPQKGKSKGKRH